MIEGKRAGIVLAIALGFATEAAAENADYYRGGWRTDGGDPHVYQFVIRGETVTGVYCTHCADATTLAPLEGTFSEDGGITFTIRHLKLDGKPDFQTKATARLEGGKLAITGESAGRAFRQETIKDPRGPDAAPYPVAILPPDAPPVPLLQPAGAGAPPPAPAPYRQPAPWRSLSASDVEGVWLGFGVGMNKQYFLIRRDGEGLFGLACGRCDNPYTFGALENFRIEGDRLEFDIVHQDWGEGTVLPFTRHVSAHIAMNEMRMDARRADIPGGAPIVASLVGPIALEATKGNVVGE
ncbi:hypothetical protein [Altererythrobacter fulvus]|uniref:hypothetical protein n=1 Tax=Caenibius fulvus TaxID=2126012 RepID=UPI0030199B6F